MTDQELIQALREHAEWAAGNEWETPLMLGDDLTAAADRIANQNTHIAALQKAIEDLRAQLSRWIPVAERLPETADDAVLVCASGKPTKCVTLQESLELACYSPNCGWILESWPDWENANVTHWMPLPPAPEVE